MIDRLTTIKRCADIVKRKLTASGKAIVPEITVVLGTGLSGFETKLEDAVEIPYKEIGLPQPTVSGHNGYLYIGHIKGKSVAILSGRVHYYEGYSMDEVVLGVRVMGILGSKILLVSNSAGGINPEMKPGTIMLILDHINLMGNNPLRGPNLEELGPRFPDMTQTYDPELIRIFKESANDLGISLNEGVYVGFMGPMYETPAEIRAAKILGGDAVGMSTIPEIIAARHMGMRIAAVSCITNLAAGLSKSALSHEEVTLTSQKMSDLLHLLFQEVIKRI